MRVDRRKGILRRAWGRRAALLTLGCLLVFPTQAANRLYRFVNAQGAMEISHTIPSDRVPLGYDIITPNGRLLQRVEPQKSPEEVERLEREERRRNACRDAMARVNRLYESERDIEAALEQTLMGLEGRIENAKANLAHVRSQRRDLEDTAAQLERSGKSVNAVLLGNIDRAKSQEDNLEREIDQRREEQSQAKIDYAKDLDMFRQANCERQTDLGVTTADSGVQAVDP